MFFFAFLHFFLKKIKNVLQNRDYVLSLKITKKSSPGTRFGTQNGLESTSEAQKPLTFPEKVDFLTVRFLTVFSSTEQNGKNPQKDPNLRAAFRNDGPRRARRRGKERQALPVRHGFSLGSNTPAPLSGYGEFRMLRGPPPLQLKVWASWEEKAREERQTDPNFRQNSDKLGRDSGRYP